MCWHLRTFSQNWQKRHKIREGNDSQSHFNIIKIQSTKKISTREMLHIQVLWNYGTLQKLLIFNTPSHIQFPLHLTRQLCVVYICSYYIYEKNIISICAKKKYTYIYLSTKFKMHKNYFAFQNLILCSVLASTNCFSTVVKVASAAKRRQPFRPNAIIKNALQACLL